MSIGHVGVERPRDEVYRSFRQRLAWAQHLAKVGLRVSKERPRVQALGRHVEPFDTIIDVGAHLGYLTKEFARLHSSCCDVIAFEPIAYTHSILKLVCARRSNVTVEKLALSNVNGRLDMRIPLKDGGTLGIGLANGQTGQARERDYVVEQVQMVRLDDYLDAHPPFGRVGLIKVDIEGAELEMLRGAERTLASDRPALYLEVDKVDPRPYLFSLGYRAFGMEADGTLREPRPSDGDLLFKARET